MKRFEPHTGLVVPLDRVNVDTDAMIPKQFLKRIERTGYGQYLFYDWRYDASGKMNNQFVLNFPQYKGASILLARDNFGCGSSREHAPWGLEDYGISVIIAPSFAEIFYNNCFKNGVLPIVLSGAEVDRLIEWASRNESFLLDVDLKKQMVSDRSGKLSFRFQIENEQKQRLLLGLDDIQVTLQSENLIHTFENQRKSWLNPKERV